MNPPVKFSEEAIEDVIDGLKQLGYYNIPEITLNDQKPQNTRYAYSAPAGRCDNMICLDSCPWIIEGEINDGRDCISNFVGPTDSEITVLRVKMDNSLHKSTPINNWNMKDAAIPGDGTHLGESPSLVNLATIIDARTCEGREYLVPLSSWDPSDKPHNIVKLESDNMSSSSTTLDLQVDTDQAEKVDLQNLLKVPNCIVARPTIANKFTKFFRKHLLMKKKLKAVSNATNQRYFSDGSSHSKS